MPFKIHAVVQHADNQNLTLCMLVEYDMRLLSYSTQT